MILKLSVEQCLNTFGNIFRVEIFGESHGPALGCTLDGIVKDKERYTRFGSDEHALIPAFKMTVKEA